MQMELPASAVGELIGLARAGLGQFEVNRANLEFVAEHGGGILSPAEAVEQVQWHRAQTGRWRSMLDALDGPTVRVLYEAEPFGVLEPVDVA